MKAKYLLFLLLFLLLPASVASAGEAQDFTRAKDAWRQLSDSSARQLYRHNWEKVIGGFVAFADRYPASSLADDALFMAGKASCGLYRISRIRKDATDAISLFDRLARTYPGSNLADDGLYQSGELFESELASPQDAYRSYRRILDETPGGDMGPAARQKLIALAAYAPPSAKAPAPAAAGTTPPRAQGPSLLGAVRGSTRAGGTRVVLELDRPAEFSWNRLGGKEPRLYVDLKNVRPAASLPSSLALDSREVLRVRTGIQEGERIRVVVDLKGAPDASVFSLADPERIIIDLGKAPASSAAGPDPIAGMIEKSAQKKVPRVQIKQAGGDGLIRRVVIDAGHGGKDPGAVGKGGTYEKEVALAIARQTAALLRRQTDIEVILTRDDDIYLPLSDRTALANQVEADLFVSIHANASENRDVYGVETFYLNFAKNDQAAGVAARENNISLKEVGDLELILFDLMANAKINESSRLAGVMQKSLVKELETGYTKIRDLGVKQGPFYVLLGATMPSVLVEAAFISNAREEARLKSEKYQQRVAQGVVSAIREYARTQQLAGAR